MIERTAEEALALRVLEYSRNELMASLRYMDRALYQLKYLSRDVQGMGTDGTFLYFRPEEVFRWYKEGSEVLNHVHLHGLMHCIFYHPFVDKQIDQPLWDLACDIAIEGLIEEMNLPETLCHKDPVMSQELKKLREKYGTLTAEKLYRGFFSPVLGVAERKRLGEIFFRDDHRVWYPEEEQDEDGQGQGDSQDQEKNQDEARKEWQDISEEIQIDLETRSKERGDEAGSFRQQLQKLHRQEYDYETFLRKFSVLGENVELNDEEFDYVYYSYGLELYGDVPLVEPLEYKETLKIRDFVIAVDTSGSVKGDLVQKFLEKTYDILMGQSHFFEKINVHIIQCDAKIQRDDVIHSKEEFEELMMDFELQGFGGTDFRPVFRYVDELEKQGAFEQLKGLIYFTDGNGIYPEKKPDYDAAFVFVQMEDEIPQVPPWAIRLVLQEENL